MSSPPHFPLISSPPSSPEPRISTSTRISPGPYHDISDFPISISISPHDDEPRLCAIQDESRPLLDIDSSSLDKSDHSILSSFPPSPNKLQLLNRRLSQNGRFSILPDQDVESPRGNPSLTPEERDKSPFSQRRESFRRLPSPKGARNLLFLGDPSHYQIITLLDDLTATFYGYKLVPSHNAFFQAACVLSLGILLLVVRWMPKLRFKLTMRPCSLKNASHIFIINAYNQISIEKINHEVFHSDLSATLPAAVQLSTPENQTTIKTLTYRHIKYLLLPPCHIFTPLFEWSDPLLLSPPSSSGLPDNISSARQYLFGVNVIDIPLPGTFKLLIDEVLHPFYMFQVASIVLWCIDDYYLYAITIAIISIASAISTLIETKRNLIRLRDMSRYTCPIQVRREGKWQNVDSSELVPGDVFSLLNISNLPVDCVLLLGDVIVNESMLTGESIPISKSPIKKEDWESETLAYPGDLMTLKSLSKHILFAGTKIVRTTLHESSLNRGSELATDQKAMLYDADDEDIHEPDFFELGLDKPTALVLRTGFMTTRGHLTLSMLFPKPHQFHFYRDSFR